MDLKTIENEQKNNLIRQDIMNNIRNGRVNIMGEPITTQLLPLFEERNNGNTNFYREALTSIAHINPLQENFFSEKNIEILQTLISYHVKLQTDGKHQIARQDDNQLKIVMKSVYLMYGKNQSVDIQGQVKILNSYVLDYCVPNIISNIEQYIGYKKQVSTLPTPLELPRYTSKAGTRTNPDFVL